MCGRVRVCACARIASAAANWILLLFFILKSVPRSVSRSVPRSVSLAVSWTALKSPAAGGFAVPLAVPLAVPQGVPLAVSWPCLLAAGLRSMGGQRVGRASAWRCLLAGRQAHHGGQAGGRQRVGSVSAGGRLGAPWGSCPRLLAVRAGRLFGGCGSLAAGGSPLHGLRARKGWGRDGACWRLGRRARNGRAGGGGSWRAPPEITPLRPQKTPGPAN